MKEPLKARNFVEFAVEASYYVAPRAPGLTSEELVRIGACFGLKPGAVRDALEEADDVERPVGRRIYLRPGAFFTNGHIRWRASPRKGTVYEAIASFIRGHLEEHGKSATTIPREEIDNLVGDTHALQVELAMMQLQRLVQILETEVTVTPMGVSYFRDFERLNQTDIEYPRDWFPEILREVEHTIKHRPADPGTGAVSKPRSQAGREAAKMQARNRVFVSHSSENVKVVNDFVRLVLEAGIGVPASQIFFSARAGSIPAGKYYIPYIREQLVDARLVIGWITPQFYNSAFCMCELGAAWASVPDGFIPILDSIGYDQTKAVLSGMQAYLAKKREDLNALRELVTAALGVTPTPHNRWEEERDEFLKRHM